ncbi:MAG: glycosyltransferase [Oscillospiraceae bacterium]|nr:glycosyltransferase [Oscillospiraceae bacterium]
MIVKNEEKNIETALSWAKGIAFEQIVVDTGSTDRTIEIAEQMGAKVLRFEWVNDFSAAKNFALENARGNWVAFLDADEYMSGKDAKKLAQILKKIQADPQARGKYKALNFPIAHVDESGKPFSIQDQERVFSSFARYVGRIHEHIDIPSENIAHVDEITIIHTGYSNSALEETDKAGRNIALLRAGLSDEPGDLNLMVYLADSLMTKSDAASIAEAEELFYEAITGGGDKKLLPGLKNKAYKRIIMNYDVLPKKAMELEELCREAFAEFPSDLDFRYYLGVALNGKDKHGEAHKVLTELKGKLQDEGALTDSEVISADPELVDKQLEIAAETNRESTKGGSAMQNPVEQFNKAVELVREGSYEQALEILLSLEKNKELMPFCHYQIARISNMTGDPQTAYDLYYSAFNAKPDIMAALSKNAQSANKYVFHGLKDEKENTVCPLCGAEGTARWCYCMAEADAFNEFFNPIRMWMYCEMCHHMFARDYPEKLFLHNTGPRSPNTGRFAYYSKVLSNIRMGGFASGMSLLEVGIGACECLLAAREMGYEIFGIDVIERHVEEAKRKFGLDVQTADWNEFESDRKWDIIIMGDVLEHVSDPDKALAKAESLLSDDGALWISTPSFESAFSCVVGHDDAMRRQPFHLNYFSRESLYMLLERNYLMPVDYQISEYYNGSMEVVAVKTDRDMGQG